MKTKIKNWLDLGVKWLVLSSKDPNKAGATTKAVLTLGAAKLVDVADLIHFQAFDAQVINQIIDGVSMVVQYGLGFIGAVAFVIGLARKIWATLKGENAVVEAHKEATQ